MQIKGKLKEKLGIELFYTKENKEIQKQIIVIDTGAKYNPYIALTVFGNNINSVDTINIGSEIIADISISSREYKGKWYTEASLFKIEAIAIQNNEPHKNITIIPSESHAPIINNNDDLPF
jgi:hypothetical protein